MPSPTSTRYANSNGVHIAYQVVGQGPVDLIFVPGWVSHLEHHWEEPRLAYFLHRLADISRLIILDKRGTGLSDRVTQQPDLEQRMDDVRAVQDAVGSKRAVLFGYSEGGSMCQLYSATHPARVLALITYGCWAKRLRTPDHPWGPTLEQRQQYYDSIESGWGGVVDLADLAPSVARDPEFCEWFAAYLRRSASPGAALALAQMNAHIDLRPVLASIRVPTMIIHRTDDREAEIGAGRYLADHIPNAKLVELPGADHLPWVGDAKSVLQAVEEFLLGLHLLPQPARSLVVSLSVHPRFGGFEHDDQRAWTSWRRAAVRILADHGAETINPGVEPVWLTTFTGAIRAIRCALRLQSSLREYDCSAGILIRLEKQLQGAEVPLLESFAADLKTSDLVNADEILVSREIKDLAGGSGIVFLDRHKRRGRRQSGMEYFRVEPQGPAGSVAHRSSPRSRQESVRHALTQQQYRILQLVAQGLSNREIAQLVRRSEHTVHRHMANIFDRLGVETRAAAVARVMQ